MRHRTENGKKQKITHNYQNHFKNMQVDKVFKYKINVDGNKMD